MVGESQEAVGAGVGSSATPGASNKMPTLSEYGTNLTQQALEVSREALDVVTTKIPIDHLRPPPS